MSIHISHAYFQWYITYHHKSKAKENFHKAKLLCIIYDVVQWSEFLAAYPEARVRYPELPEKKKVVGLERGPLSLVSTTEELLDRTVASPV
jgi:hypothetical protein